MWSSEKKKLREILDLALCPAFLSAVRLWSSLHKEWEVYSAGKQDSFLSMAVGSQQHRGAGPYFPGAHQRPCGQNQGFHTTPPSPSHVPQHGYFSSSMVHSLGCLGQVSVDLPSTSPCVLPLFLLFLSGLGKVHVLSAKAFPPFAESTAGFPYTSCKLHTQGWGWRRRSSWPVVPFVGMEVWAPWLSAPSLFSGAQGHLSRCPGRRRACPQRDSVGTGLEQGMLSLMKRGLFNTCLHSMCKYYEESEKKSPESHFTQMLPWIDYCPFMAEGETW